MSEVARLVSLGMARERAVELVSVTNALVLVMGAIKHDDQRAALVAFLRKYAADLEVR